MDMNGRIVLGIVLWALAAPLFAMGQGKTVPSDSCTVKIDLPGVESGQILLSGNNVLEIRPDTLPFEQQRVELKLPIRDTVFCFVKVVAPELGATTAYGKALYPKLDLLLVPFHRL